MPTATININISGFKADGCCAIDRPSIAPGGHSHRIAYKSEDPASPDFHTITVKSKGRSPLNLEFAITPAGAYHAKRISFNQTSGAHDPAGTENFKNHSRKEGVITVTNVFAHSGRGSAAPKWDYTIEVTQLSSGLTGMIDPGIENTETDAD